jgi:dipeptidyl aminopeptidase/acylaminoacyl peptidase
MRRTVFRIVAFTSIFLCVAGSRGRAEALDAKRVLDWRKISDLQFSPDGKKLAFVVDGPTQGAERPSHIWLLDVASNNLRQLTFSGGSEKSPRWSLEGKWLAFLSTRDGASKIYRVGVDGGEAQPMFTFGYVVRSFAWSLDGMSIAFTAPNLLTDAQQKKIADKDDSHEWNDPSRLVSLWVVGTRDGDQPRAISAPGWIVGEYIWTDANHLLVVGAPKPTEMSFNESLWIASTDANPWTEWARMPIQLKALRLSPDRAHLAFIASGKDGPKGHDLFVADMAMRQYHNITAGPLDRLVESFQWTSDTELLLSYQEGFLDLFARITLAGKMTSVPAPVHVGDIVSSSVGALAWFGGSATQMPELWISNANQAAHCVSHFHDAWRDIKLFPLEKYHYRSFDGRMIEAALLRPGNGTGNKPPLIVYVHGGPSSRWRDSFEVFGWEQLLASRGYTVLLPNPRGSSGYGQEFMTLDRYDWGGQDSKDIMAGVDDAIKRGIADPDHIGIIGYSYGGFMTNTLITRTNLFRAAVSGASLSDLAAELGSETYPVVDLWFLGMWSDDPTNFIRMSPAYHVSSNVKTPTLLFQGEADDTDPEGQSIEFYRALKTYDVPTQLIIYPREGHVLTEEKHVIDMDTRMIDWLDKYVKPEKTDTAAKQ